MGIFDILSTALMLIIVSLPLSIPALWALLTTAPENNHDRSQFLLVNRRASFGLGILAVLACSVLGLYVVLHFANCDVAFEAASICEAYPIGESGILPAVVFAGKLYLIAIGLPALVCYIAAEALTRFRLKRSNQNA